MKKIITQEQFNRIINVLTKWNVGVKDYYFISDIWDKAEVVKEDQVTENNQQ